MIISLVLPFLFIHNLKKTDRPTLTKLTLFNFIEYICLQASISALFTNAKTICYGSDGQNGIELIFTAWISLPILILLSFLFKDKF